MTYLLDVNASCEASGTAFGYRARTVVAAWLSCFVRAPTPPWRHPEGPCFFGTRPILPGGRHPMPLQSAWQVPRGGEQTRSATLADSINEALPGTDAHRLSRTPLRTWESATVRGTTGVRALTRKL